MATAATATYAGRTLIWEHVNLAAGTAIPKYIQWGTGSGLTDNGVTVTGSANANVNLFAPATEARTTGTAALVTTNYLGDTLQVTGTITCAVAAKTITEVGLFDSSTAQTVASLSASLTASATSMTVSANIGPTSGNYYAQVGLETILVTGANSTTLTISRGVLGTTGAIHQTAQPVTSGGDGSNNSSTGTTGQTATYGASQGGNCFIHADFSGIALNVNDSIAFTVSDTLT